MKDTKKNNSEEFLFQKYYIIGNGRLGRQLQQYFNFLDIPFKLLSRNDLNSTGLKNLKVENNTHPTILLAVSDPEIEAVCRHIRNHSIARMLHFSASVQTEYAEGFHPLYSFNNRDLSLEELKAIPFIVDLGKSELFRILLPFSENPVFELDKNKSSEYHALAVLLGNLPITLSHISAQALEKNCGLPREAMIPFLESLLENFKNTDQGPVASGPIGRKDTKTLTAHLEALASDKFLQDTYKLFIQKEWPEYKDSL